MSHTLSAQRIAELDRLSPTQVAIEVVAETGSTNTDLLGRVGSLSVPTLLLAESQTQGRGRAGRSWLSASGASLTFSLAWRFDGGVQALAGLPLAVGVAIAQALDVYDVHIALKWPNDVLKDGNKLAGVLIETAVDGDHVWAIIGIGLNLALPDQLEAQIGQPAAEARWLAQLDRNALMAKLLDHLYQALVQFGETGFVAFVERWNVLHAHAGQMVSIVDAGRLLYQGLAVGVDEIGRLLLNTTVGRVAVVAGDVSLRAKEQEHAAID